MEQLIIEQNPETNPLIPGGKAAAVAQRQLEASDTTAEGVRRREMQPEHNPLIGSGDIGYPEIPQGAGGNWTWRESRQLWFRTK